MLGQRDCGLGNRQFAEGDAQLVAGGARTRSCKGKCRCQTADADLWGTSQHVWSEDQFLEHHLIQSVLLLGASGLCAQFLAGHGDGRILDKITMKEKQLQ